MDTNTKSNPSVLVVLSGGMDSGVAAWMYRNALYNVQTISFNYGQRHVRELTYANKMSQHLTGKDAQVIDLTSFGRAVTGNALTDHSIDVPTGEYSHETMGGTVVPNRNAVMLSIAFSIASARGIDHVAIGVHGGDHALYPDCRPVFIEDFQHMADSSLYGMHTPELLAPFLNMSKRDIVEVGQRIDMDWSLTWSCYTAGPIHCGVCSTCMERKQAFKDAGVTDPTVYEK